MADHEDKVKDIIVYEGNNYAMSHRALHDEEKNDYVTPVSMKTGATTIDISTPANDKNFYPKKYPDALSRSFSEGGYTFLHRVFRKNINTGYPVVINTGELYFQYQHLPGHSTFEQGITLLDGDSDTKTYRLFMAVVKNFSLEKAISEGEYEKQIDGSVTKVYPEIKEQLRRLYRRRKIAEELRIVQNGKKRSPREIIENTKKADSIIFEDVIADLSSKEFFVHEKLQRLAIELQVELQKKFPEFDNLSVIIMGSAINPTGMIKKLFNGELIPHDLDWGITYDSPSLSPEEQRVLRGKMVNYANILIPTLGEKYGLPNIQGCDSINPAYQVYLTPEFYVYNFKSIDEAYKYIKDKDGIGSLKKDPIFLYFLPSIPPNLNQRNKEFLLLALKRLSLNNYELYKLTIDNLITYWEDLREISIKHFENDYIDYDKLGSKDRVLAQIFYYYAQRKEHFFGKHFIEEISKTDGATEYYS